MAGPLAAMVDGSGGRHPHFNAKSPERPVVPQPYPFTGTVGLAPSVTEHCSRPSQNMACQPSLPGNGAQLAYGRWQHRHGHGPAFTTAIIAVVSWRWTLVALGGALGLGALLVSTTLPSERPPDEDGTTRERVPLRQLLSRPGVAVVLLASTIAAGGRGFGTLSTYLPADLRSDLGLPTITVGTVFTVVMAASVVGSVVAGRLADRFGRRRVLVATYFSAAGALAAFGFARPHLALLVPLGILVGILAYAESPPMRNPRCCRRSSPTSSDRPRHRPPSASFSPSPMGRLSLDGPAGLDHHDCGGSRPPFARWAPRSSSRVSSSPQDSATSTLPS